MEEKTVQPNLVVNNHAGFFGIKVVDQSGREIPDEAPSGPYDTKKMSGFSLFGICFDQQCKDQQAAGLALQRAQAEALAHLNDPSANTINPGKIMLYGTAATVLIIASIAIAVHFKK